MARTVQKRGGSGFSSHRAEGDRGEEAQLGRRVRAGSPHLPGDTRDAAPVQVGQPLEQSPLVGVEREQSDPHGVEHALHVCPVELRLLEFQPRIDGPFEPGLLIVRQPRQHQLHPYRLACDDRPLDALGRQVG